MTSTKEALTPLKADTRGRIRTPVAQQERLLDEFERSGLSGAKFAALVGVKYTTFASWIHRRRKQRGSTSPKPAKEEADSVQWLEAVVSKAANPSSGSGLVVELSCGVRLEITDETQATLAAKLLRAWEKAAVPC